MKELFEKLGIDIGLLFSQAVNFLLLLTVMILTVYKPLLRVINERKERIKIGLEKAKEAEEKLAKIDKIGAERMQKAEEEAIKIIKETEEKAKLLEQEARKNAQEKQRELLVQAQERLKMQLEENKKIVLAQTADLIKKIIVKTVELKPDEVDNALISKAIKIIEKEN